MADVFRTQNIKGLVVLELGDGTIMQYRVSNVRLEATTEEDDSEMSFLGPFAAPQLHHTLDFTGTIDSGVITKPGKAGEVV